MRTRLFAIGRGLRVSLWLALGAVDAASAQVTPRDLSAQPPRVVSAVARLLSRPIPGGNALIEVKVASDEILPPLITVDLESGKTTLRDDGKEGDRTSGDRVYSAIVALDIAAMRRNQARVAQLEGRFGKLVMPVYRGRQRVGRVALSNDFFAPLVTGTDVVLDKWGFAQAITEQNSLVIRDVSVVEDPARTYDPCNNSGTSMGKWTFGFLMSQIANKNTTGLDPAEFVRQWIELSRTDQTVNGWDVPAFPLNWNAILDAWPKLGNGSLDLAKAPFKLLAIVNRVDLRHNVIYGGSNGGEARFVFGFKRCSPQSPIPQVTVILEYGIQAKGCSSIKAWAQQWQALGNLALGSAAYLAALETITDQFSVAGAAPTKPNQSALNQLRTNGGAVPQDWEMREFRLSSRRLGGSYFALSTVKQTPDSRVVSFSYPFPDDITNYVNDETPAILADQHVVPNSYAGRPFLGGVADAQPPPSGWNLPNVINREARHKFALQTCNGCHLLETGTTDFFHIRPPVSGSGTAQLSGFMTGIDVVDPFDASPTRHFDELERRAVDLDALANSACIFFVDSNERFKDFWQQPPIPLNMTH